jgi:FkbM family methyltransferase
VGTLQLHKLCQTTAEHERYVFIVTTWEAIRWKFRQKYSQARSFLGGGYHIWRIQPGVRFVARKGDAFSHVLFVCRGHEVKEMEWCRRWLVAGDSVIDCGANIGYFSAYLAQACALERIIAVEGNHRTAAVCSANISLLDLKNVTMVEAVLAANDTDNFSIPDISGREPWQRAQPVEGRAATVTTLDSLCERHQVRPSLVKIDCEGFETLILRGAERLLDETRPAFMVECNTEALQAAGTNRTELFSVFRDHNYSAFHLASFDSAQPFGIACDANFPSAEFNFAAIPNEEVSLERWRRSAEVPVTPSP